MRAKLSHEVKRPDRARTLIGLVTNLVLDLQYRGEAETDGKSTNHDRAYGIATSAGRVSGEQKIEEDFRTNSRTRSCLVVGLLYRPVVKQGGDDKKGEDDLQGHEKRTSRINISRDVDSPIIQHSLYPLPIFTLLPFAPSPSYSPSEALSFLFIPLPRSVSHLTVRLCI